MVGCARRPGKSAKVRFADPPWSEPARERQVRGQPLPTDHPARAVMEAGMSAAGVVRELIEGITRLVEPLL